MQWKHSLLQLQRSQGGAICGNDDGFRFWDVKGIVLIDYLQEGKNINGDYYVNLLRQLRKANKSKRPRKLTKGALFHRDNAPAHKCVVTNQHA